MNRSTIAAITATAAATLAIGAGALPASAATQASVPPNPACTARQLHLTLGRERATTGHVSFTLTARNDGPACTLAGFPKLGLEDARGKHLPSSASATGKVSGKPLLYRLTAQATVSYGSDGQFGAVPAAYLTAGGKAVHIPGGIAWIYGGQLTTTTWKVG